MSVWRKTKANAARRYVRARLARLWREFADKLVDQITHAAFSGSRALMLSFCAAALAEQAVEAESFWAGAAPPSGDPFWRRDAVMHGFNCAGQIIQMGGPPQ
jgi:hypothetical protein